MVTCPWCGTSYAEFQSNCDRCGGPLSPPTEQPGAPGASQAPPTPPPAPRPVADAYAWRLVWSDGFGVVGFIFTVLGTVFAVVGLFLTLAIITSFVGLPFLLLGLVFLLGGGGLLTARYQRAMRIVQVLRVGQATTGQIERVEENLAVRVNNRHPWNVAYSFGLQERAYKGQVSTLNPPVGLQPGQPATVLYLPGAPEHNSLYPHP